MFTIAHSIRSTVNPDGAVLLDIETGRVLGLNRIGSRVFELIQSGFDQEQIASELSQQCGADVDFVRDDVLEFLQTLRRHDILVTPAID
jgi:hypothetical protein